MSQCYNCNEKDISIYCFLCEKFVCLQCLNQPHITESSIEKTEHYNNIFYLCDECESNKSS